MRPALRTVLLTQPLRVRVANIVRAAGGALFDPSISQMTVGRDGSGGAPASGGVVGRIYCATGSGRYAIAPSDAARPTLTVGAQSYLTADGVDDWMNVTPTLDLGAVWWHVGGWRSDTAGRRAFATSDLSNTAVNHLSDVPDRWVFRGEDGTTWNSLCAGLPSVVNVLTVEQASQSSITGRYNGGAAGASADPLYDTAGRGLALFSSINNAFASGIAGRFYGGPWAPGAITASDRAIVERYVAQITGVTL